MDSQEEDNRITTDFMFEHLTQLAIETYNGKKVVFIVASADIPMGTITTYDATVIIERCKTYQEQQQFVTDIVLTHSAEKIIVFTQSPVVLSDAFACQIYTWRDDPHTGIRFRYVGCMSTFGAEPGRIAINVLRLDESIGSLSKRKMEEWLYTKWTQEQAEELLGVVNDIGGGWPRAKLRETLEKLLSPEEND